MFLVLTIAIARDKLNNLVLFDKNTYDKLYKEVPTYKLITPSIVSERLKVCGLKFQFSLNLVMMSNYLHYLMNSDVNLLNTTELSIKSN